MSATLKTSVVIEGDGLHTGQACSLRLHPSEQTGIRFQLDSTRFPARWDYVIDTTRCTTLGKGHLRISTVEHLMAALWRTGITDCVVEVIQGNEVPALDGSALEFINLIESAGIETFSIDSEQKLIQKPIHVQSGDRVIILMSGSHRAFGYIRFPEPLGVQSGCFELDNFKEDIAPARTFGFLHEIEALRAQGLALGGTLENALIIGENGYYNEARFPDEPLRHKILDTLGDLYLCGFLLHDFDLIIVKSGHTIGVELARRVWEHLTAGDNYKESI
jgi:UDP-3-O-[3-hydroxymyristoyl] N-acetylglucosamine deacetylase